MTHRLLRSIISIIDAFLSNAKSDGDYQRLNKTELKKLLQEEFGNTLEVRRTIFFVTWDFYWIQWHYPLLVFLLLVQLFPLRIISSSSPSVHYLRLDIPWDSLLTSCILLSNFANTLCLNHCLYVEDFSHFISSDLSPELQIH